MGAKSKFVDGQKVLFSATRNGKRVQLGGTLVEGCTKVVGFGFWASGPFPRMRHNPLFSRRSPFWLKKRYR